MQICEKADVMCMRITCSVIDMLEFLTSKTTMADNGTVFVLLKGCFSVLETFTFQILNKVASANKRF